MNLQFWKDKKVLVTGHTGFKGSWLCSWLLMAGAEVSGFSLEPATSPALFSVLHLTERMASYIGDIRSLDKISEVIEEVKPEIVFHLAAQPIVRTSYEDPVGTYETNVMGTVHILEAIRKCTSVRAVVNITTDKVYENKEWCWGYREEDVLNGYDPYSNSKSCSELVTASYIKSFFHPEKYGKEHCTAIATARAGNVIGGGDWAKDRIIPDCVRAMEEGRNIELRNPNAVRPWQHVLEPLNGYMILAEKLYTEGVQYNGAYNFGPDEKECIPVIELVERFVKVYGSNSKIMVPDKPQPHEANFLKLDCSKAKSVLGWKPKWEITDVVEMTAGWYKDFYSQGKAIEYVEKNITLYEGGNES